MRTDLWKIYDKKGSNINLTEDSYIKIIFATDSGKDAEGYAITDPSTQIDRVHVSNGGWGYTSGTGVFVNYLYGNGVPYEVDASIVYKDVSIFNPEPSNSKSIYAVNIDDSTNYIYPSYTQAGALFLDPVSQGLIETEHLTIFQESSMGYVTPYDTENSTLVFQMLGDEEEIKFFTVDEFTQEVIWTEELVFDVSSYIMGQGLQINVGFRSEDEGVYERRLVAYHRIGDTDYPLMELVVNAQSIGQDERYDTLMDNFGLYKPKSIPKLFKEVDINEDLPDWEILNYKSKHLILEHNNIMPFIGTYKGLINAIKWLGYEDIQVKEWFKNVKENKKLSLYVPYDADERKKTIKYFSPDERKNLKKLNSLSLVYCINKETGETDDWGTPETENCYEYNLDEILIKLYSLKQWLEKNIIGVNARIIDLTGEGIYFERFQNFIYGTHNIGSVGIYEQSLTPETVNDRSELVTGDASILLTLKEYSAINIEDMEGTFLDYARYGWDPSNGFFSPGEYSKLSYIDPSAIFIGSPMLAPFKDLYDLQWKLSNQKEYGVVTTDFVTNPLFIYENTIKFYNVYDTSSLFYDVSANVDVTIEQGYLRDPSNDIWVDSIAYSIYQDPSLNGKWIFESSTGTKFYTWGEFSLQTSTNPRLMYAFDDNYKVPLLSIKGYKWTDASGVTRDLERDYYLDIIDGKIAMDSSTTAINGDEIFIENFINFNYDTSISEQQITLNVTYTSPRMPVFSFDPSDASTLYYNPGANLTLTDDNSIYQMDVNHAGDYEIEIFGWNGQNNLFYNFDRDGYDVFQKFPTINSYIDTSCAGILKTTCTSAYITPSEVSTLIDSNLNPIFDRLLVLQGLTLEYDGNDNPYINVPSISYFQDLPEKNSISKFYNLTERITSISGSNIVVDEDYQNFYANDIVNVVKFDKGKYEIIEEISTNITSASSPNFTLNTIPSGFSIDSSIEWYLLNDTEREISNPTNDIDYQKFSCDISTYSFGINQVVGILVEDLSTGYTWGSSFRVLDVSTQYDDQYGYSHLFEGNVPQFVLNDPDKYSLTAKHAFSTFSNFQIPVESAKEENNNFKLYLDDTYYHQYYLDNTFVYLSIDFDQEVVLEQWYDPSTDNMINKEFYPFEQAIELDVSSLVIFRSQYDASNYMLNQKNIWTIKENESQDTLLRVHNFIVPYIFNESGTYDIILESYDYYGNLKTKEFEGLIKIKDETS